MIIILWNVKIGKDLVALTVSYREGGVRRGHGLRSFRLSISFYLPRVSRFFLSPFNVDPLVSDITPLHEDRNGKRKKKILRTRTSSGTGRFACMMGYVVTEVMKRMTLGFRQ